LWHNPAVPARTSRFLIGLVLGLVLGLGYAWRIQPVAYYDTAPDSLRLDYRVDYILMVAQSYQAEGDLRQALLRLAALGPQPPSETVAEAIAFAEEQEFAPADRTALERLGDDLQALPAQPDLPSP
jgi:hypothetical protein